MATIGYSAASVLEAWERGAGYDAAARSRALLRLADPSAAPEVLEALPLGARDRRLWRLRVALYGRRVEAVVACPACAELMEFSLDAEDVCPAEVPELSTETRTWTDSEWVLDFHLPRARDLARLEVEGADGMALLALRCRLVEGVSKGAETKTLRDVPPAVLDRWEMHLATLDPLADLKLQLRCATCQHSWEEPFDIGSFLWAELEEEAERLLGEVHQMARAYGWSERDILSLSATRRRAYLERIEA